MDDLIKDLSFEKMISDIETLVNASKAELATSINKVITVTYWSIGKYIVEFEQEGMQKRSMGEICFPQYQREIVCSHPTESADSCLYRYLK